MAAKIIGLSVFEFGSRIFYAIANAGINFFVFFILPNFIFGIARLPISGGSNFSTSIFLPYSILLSLLGGLQIVFRGHVLATGGAIFNGIAQIYYLYLITNDGIMVLSNVGGMGFDITISYQPILYLLIIPPVTLMITSIMRTVNQAGARPVELHDEIALK
jgi:hypothetical protein